MNCDWLITTSVMGGNGMIELGWTGRHCDQPAAVRYRQRETEPWGHRCAGSHADALDRDVVQVEVLTP